MNCKQKIIFAILMVSLGHILIQQHLLVDNYTALGIAKYSAISSIFIASLFFSTPTPEHRLLARAIAFLFIRDFFLILLGVFYSPELLWIKIGGMIGFLIAYSHLIALFLRGARWHNRDFFYLLPVLLVLVPIFVLCIPHIGGAMLIFAVFFALCLSFMAWNGICAIHRGYYLPKIAYRFALAGYLIFLSDMGIALGFFYPGLTRNQPWLGNEIWLTYIPAWSLLLITLDEQQLVEQD